MIFVQKGLLRESSTQHSRSTAASIRHSRSAECIQYSRSRALMCTLQSTAAEHIVVKSFQIHLSRRYPTPPVCTSKRLPCSRLYYNDGRYNASSCLGQPQPGKMLLSQSETYRRHIIPNSVVQQITQRLLYTRANVSHVRGYYCKDGRFKRKFAMRGATINRGNGPIQRKFAMRRAASGS